MGGLVVVTEFDEHQSAQAVRGQVVPGLKDSVKSS